MKITTYQRALHSVLQEYLKDPVPNVRFNALLCLEELSRKINASEMKEIEKKAGAQLADDSDLEVKKLARALQAK